MQNLIRIAIADDRIFIRESLKKILEQVAYFQVILEVTCGEELLRSISGKKVDLAIINYKRPISHSLNTIKGLSSRFPDIKIVLLTILENPFLINHFIRKSVHGIILKTHSIIEIFDIIQVAASDRLLAPPKSEKKDKKTLRNSPSFTERELEIIELICHEKSSKEIGESLFIAKRTVDWYRKEIMKKIGVKTSIGIVKYAILSGIFIPH